MKTLKIIAKILARVLTLMNGQDAKGEAFKSNIMENVKIALDVSSEIMQELGIETEFKTRGIDSALGREIAEELEHELGD